MGLLSRLQAWLNCEGSSGPQFAHPKGLGRIATAAFVLGSIFGGHLCLIACQLYLHGPQTTLLVSSTVERVLVYLFIHVYVMTVRVYIYVNVYMNISDVLSVALTRCVRCEAFEISAVREKDF